MSNIRRELVNAAYDRAYALIDYNIQNDLDKLYEIRKQSIIDNESLTNDEKSEAIKKLDIDLDRNKILFNEGKKRICENCQEECLATLYCEYCGCSEIYTADWIGGQYYEWNSEQQQLERYGTLVVILKRLENVKSANRSWFEEAKSHLTITNKWSEIVQCYGLTQDPSNGNYMIVMRKLDISLRKYLQQNHNQLTWKDRIKITFDIIDALDSIRKENVIHRDLHSGNILYLEYNNNWYISDLGF
ncbi:kinase-like domain-containing protein, partial [Glomus cerebriforme]